MTPEEYLRQYAGPCQSSSATGSESSGDWKSLVLEPDCYYPSHLALEVGLDVLGRTELLEILQLLLATEYPQQHLSRRQIGGFLESLQRLKDERAWRQAEMERLAAVLTQQQSELMQRQAELTQRQADYERMTAELAERQSELQRLAAELERHRGEITRLDNETVILRATVADLRATVADLLASTSWKVTKPLRWFGQIVKARRLSGE